MLVLSRTKSESVLIETPAGVIGVMVVEVRGDKVRLGFTAPASYAIARSELLGEIPTFLEFQRPTPAVSELQPVA